jgi:hypothetical protein
VRCAQENIRSCVRFLVEQDGDFHVDPELGRVVVLNDGFDLRGLG